MHDDATEGSSVTPLPLIDMDALAAIATGRDRSLFARDMADRAHVIAAAVAGRRILVTGGAGSIGSSTIRRLLPFAPAALHVVDLGENALADLARDLRVQGELPLPPDLRFLPIDFGSGAMQRLLATEAPYDLVLHFAAHKHVRSEKDMPSLVQMIDTNVVKLRRFLQWLDRFGHRPDIFAVSTDKAANPSSLMGATKRLMEHVLFGGPAGTARTRSARFANVAFSNGSLPQAFLQRIERRQPLAAPDGILRYFVSLREAGEICTLAATAGPGGAILYPDLDPGTALVTMTAVAEGVLRHFGLTPTLYDEEHSARTAVERDLAGGCYPVLVTRPDTSGEKPFEEFVAIGEVPVAAGFEALRAIGHAGPPVGLEDLLDWLEALARDGTLRATKADVAARIARAIPGFGHVETGRSLDERP